MQPTTNFCIANSNRQTKMKILFILSSGNTSALPQGLRSQFGYNCKVVEPSEDIVIPDETDVLVLDHTLPEDKTSKIVQLLSAAEPSIPIVEVIPETPTYRWPLMNVRYKPPGSTHADGYTGPESPLSWDGEEYLLRRAIEDCRKN